MSIVSVINLLFQNNLANFSYLLFSYLHQEWIARKVNNKVAAPKNKISDEQTKAEESQSSAVSEAVSDKSCEEVTEYTLTEKELELAFKKIKQIPCKVNKSSYQTDLLNKEFFTSY